MQMLIILQTLSLLISVIIIYHVRFLLMSKAGWYLKWHMPTPQVICMTAYKMHELH